MQSGAVEGGESAVQVPTEGAPVDAAGASGAVGATGPSTAGGATAARPGGAAAGTPTGGDAGGGAAAPAAGADTGGVQLGKGPCRSDGRMSGIAKYMPPCLSFTGDNGGATARGVERQHDQGHPVREPDRPRHPGDPQERQARRRPARGHPGVRGAVQVRQPPLRDLRPRGRLRGVPGQRSPTRTTRPCGPTPSASPRRRRPSPSSPGRRCSARSSPRAASSASAPSGSRRSSTRRTRRTSSARSRRPTRSATHTGEYIGKRLKGKPAQVGGRRERPDAGLQVQGAQVRPHLHRGPAGPRRPRGQADPRRHGPRAVEERRGAGRRGVVPLRPRPQPAGHDHDDRQDERGRRDDGDPRRRPADADPHHDRGDPPGLLPRVVHHRHRPVRHVGRRSHLRPEPVGPRVRHLAAVGHVDRRPPVRGLPRVPPRAARDRPRATRASSSTSTGRRCSSCSSGSTWRDRS